ncbi:MAG: peptide-methionine (S)-S-oxide reductase MsrA [Rhodocyclaceae bacterium]|nr:peptide-methionine (S)-S-oxide reductase MsrA [Rhodocyclaceae bacterium]MBX3666807.1 peptide-methionine (S)-S-oxide reductase MsrA [Rhodocyclaceae bacterium]
MDTQSKHEIAILGGGCFWCLEAVFDRLDGVASVESGYCGGSTERPTYRQVCDGDSGHAEVVRIAFDPARISFRELLEVFYAIHDPTTRNRQGNDVGTQYRSAIFWTTPEQRDTAKAVIAELDAAGEFSRPIVTEVSAAQKFWVAEDYHQEYYDHNAYQPYCQVVVGPKVDKFRQKFAQRVKAGR